MRPPTVIDAARLIAGRHPCASGPEGARAEVESLREAGVTLFLDLTQDGELEPYAAHVVGPGRYVNRPIGDFSVPTREDLIATLDEIDAELAARRRRIRALLGGMWANGRRRRSLARAPRARPGGGAPTDRRCPWAGLPADVGAAGARAFVAARRLTSPFRVTETSDTGWRSPLRYVQLRMSAGSPHQVVSASMKRASGHAVVG